MKTSIIPLDNNQSERGYVWVAVGRRSFWGSRSELGTQVAAILYSLAETARRNGVDPKAYFEAALGDALNDRLIRLPGEWPASRASAEAEALPRRTA